MIREITSANVFRLGKSFGTPSRTVAFRAHLRKRAARPALRRTNCCYLFANPSLHITSLQETVRLVPLIINKALHLHASKQRPGLILKE